MNNRFLSTTTVAMVLALSAATWIAPSAAEASRKTRKTRPTSTPVAVSITSPTPTLSLGIGYPRVCDGLEDLGVPASDIASAIEDPMRIPHWNRLDNPNLPPSPWNLRARFLTISVTSKPYHPLFNGLEFKSHCMHR